MRDQRNILSARRGDRRDDGVRDRNRKRAVLSVSDPDLRSRYQPSQRSQPSAPSQTYQSSQPSQTYQSSQPAQRSSQPTRPIPRLRHRSRRPPSSSSPRPIHRNPRRSRSRNRAQQPSAHRRSPTSRRRPARRWRKIPRAALNSDKSVQPDASIGGCNAVIQETAKNLAAAYFYPRRRPPSPRATSTAPSPTTPRRSRSIRPKPTISTAAPRSTKHKNDMTRAMADYDTGDQAQSEIGLRLQQPRRQLPAQGRLRPRLRRLRRGDAAAAEQSRRLGRALLGARRRRPRGAAGAVDCNESLKLKADQPDVLDTRGFVNLRLGKMDDAIKDYDAALKLDPKLPGALYGRGVAKTKKGDRPAAVPTSRPPRAMKSDIEVRVLALRHP